MDGFRLVGMMKVDATINVAHWMDAGPDVIATQDGDTLLFWMI